MAIETILKRSFHGVALLLIAVVAYFQARGAGQLISMALMNHTERRSTLPEPNGAPLAPMPTPENTATAPVRVDNFDPLASPSCEGVQALIITESSDPWWSLATLQASGEERPRLRRVGDGIAGRRVAFIGFNPRQQLPAVWLEGRGALCQSLMLRQATPATVLTAAPVTPTPTIAAADIPRHQAAILSQVRVAPEQKDGKIIGLRLFGIRQGSLLNTLGLRNGDRLESINGFQIADPEQALRAYARLRTASHLHVSLTRVGKPMEIDLNIS